jgi:hypothetical protein
VLQKKYGGVIWTNHALQRLAERGLSQKMAFTAFQYPDDSLRLDSGGTMEYRKSFGTSVVTVVAKKNNQHQWIIVSSWINPPIAGTIDSKRRAWFKKFREAGFWGKFWMEIKRALTGRNY